MFVVEGGLYNFGLFDDNAGNIQLLFVLLAQTLFLPWVVGMDKLSTLIYLHTGEYVPTFFVLVIRIFCPIFATIIFIISVVNEWDIEGRLEKKWTQGHIWGARMIWIIPLLSILITAFMPLKNQKSFDELVFEQFGLRFKNETTFVQKLYMNRCEYEVENNETYKKCDFADQSKCK